MKRFFGNNVFMIQTQSTESNTLRSYFEDQLAVTPVNTEESRALLKADRAEQNHNPQNINVVYPLGEKTVAVIYETPGVLTMSHIPESRIDNLSRSYEFIRMAAGNIPVIKVKSEPKAVSLTLYSKNNCIYCMKAKKLLSDSGIKFEEINIDDDPKGEEIKEWLITEGHKTMPQIYNGEELYVTGGYDGLANLLAGKEQIDSSSLGSL